MSQQTKSQLSGVYGADGYKLEMDFIASFAFELVRHFGAVAGKRSESDATEGHAVLELQTPQELVDRCFEIADIFMTKGMLHGSIKLLVMPKQDNPMKE